MTQPVIDARTIAEAFVDARRASRALADYPGTPPHGLAQAYAVQDAAIRLFGKDIAGWKVGRINSPWFEPLGVSRLAGPIFADAVQPHSPGAVPAGDIFKQGFGAVEAEFIFRIGTAPRPGQTSFTADEAAALVDAVYCGFEIASSPFSGINALGPLVTISDFGNNNGLLLGPEIPDWRTADFADWQVATHIDGTLIGSGTAAAFPGGPLESLRFLLENIIARGHPVTPGLLISSGAVTGVHEVTAGQSVAAEFGTQCILHCSIQNAAD